MIKFIDVTKRYGKNIILKNVSFTIEENDFVILSGVNGSGKTTILNLINGILHLKRRDKGKIISSKSISYFPDKIILPPYINGFDLLMRFLNEFSSIYEINEYMTKYKVPKKDVNLYSKGMIQKLVIIKTLLTPRDVYIFDEPINGLDIESKKIFVKDLKELSKNKKTIIISTHEKHLFSKIITKEITLDKGDICIKMI